LKVFLKIVIYKYNQKESFMKKLSILLATVLTLGTAVAAESKKEEAGLQKAAVTEKTESGKFQKVTNPLYRGG
jgi:hypothetical protein